jgi:hypothetical protein
MATIVGILFSLAVAVGGSLTEVSGGTTVAIATASADVTSIWTPVLYIPIVFTLVAFLVTTYKVAKSI